MEVRRKNVLGIYLLSLSLCDLMYLCTLPLWMVYVNEGHEWKLGSLSCKITGYIFFNNMYISIFLLCCISIDRYVAVVYAVESRGMRQQRLAGAICVGVCLLVALVHMPVFTMPEGDADKTLRHCFEPVHNSARVAGFNCARFVVGFIIPLSILVVTNRAILLNIQASPSLRSYQKIKVKYLAIGVIVFFLVCFAPYHMVLLLRAITFYFSELETNCEFEKSIYTPYTIFLGLSTINSAMNPILYVLASDNIRKEIKQSLASLSSRAPLQPRLTDSSQHKMQSSDVATHRDNHSC
ncbi:putative G-protein coupled receptor 132 [Arapaima gigas]